MLYNPRKSFLSLISRFQNPFEKYFTIHLVGDVIMLALDNFPLKNLKKYILF